MPHATHGGRAALIINPISGLGARPDAARRRAEQAASLADARGIDIDIFVTERGGHARELAEAAVLRGVTSVVAWGGDGTVNEVASALAFRDVSLGIVPGGSGNGLARELGLPFDAPAAFDVAFGGACRQIDAGELDGRLFVNVAGVGVDAAVAHRFAEQGMARRGLAAYVDLSARALFTFEPQDATLVVDGTARAVRPLLVAFANARQYGNGALIAPAARVDDGQLDIVVVDHRSVWAVLAHVPALFRGRLGRVPGVTMQTARTALMSCDRPIRYHVDGEPFVGGDAVGALVRPGALRVSVPPSDGGAR